MYVDEGRPAPGLIEQHACATCARSSRPSTSTCRAASTCCCRSWSRTTRCAARCSSDWRACSTPPRRCRRACGQRLEGGGAPGARAAAVVHLVLGRHRDLAGRHHRCTGASRRAGCIGAAAAGRRAEAGAQRRQARDAGARAQRLPRLPRRAASSPPRPSTRRATTGSATPASWSTTQRPERGVSFDGRVAEDFKLVSGTWVRWARCACARSSRAGAAGRRRRGHRPRPRGDRPAGVPHARRPAALPPKSAPRTPALTALQRAGGRGRRLVADARRGRLCSRSRRAPTPARSPTRATSTSAPCWRDVRATCWRCIHR